MQLYCNTMIWEFAKLKYLIFSLYQDKCPCFQSGRISLKISVGYLLQQYCRWKQQRTKSPWMDRVDVPVELVVMEMHISPPFLLRSFKNEASSMAT